MQEENAAWLGVQHSGITALDFTLESEQTPNAHGRNPASGKEKAVETIAGCTIKDGGWEFIFELVPGMSAYLCIRMVGRDTYRSRCETVTVLLDSGEWLFNPPEDMKSVAIELLDVMLPRLPIIWASAEKEFGSLDAFCSARDQFIEINTVKKLRRKIEDKLRKNPELVKPLALIMGIS